MNYQVLLFYKYVTIEDPTVLMHEVRTLAQKHHLLGRVLIAEEGINGTLEGTLPNTEAFVSAFFSNPRFTDILVKRSTGNGVSFKKLVVKVRDEIVGTRFDKEIDPRVRTAPRIQPEELRSWYEQGEDFVVVDMRNDYEYRSGHFTDSINPGLSNSRDLPEALPKLAVYKDKKVLTVCTGGVRCEKMSAYLLHEGFSDVYQLENGIHGYMEKYPGKDFKGTLYTFDKRLTMDFGGDREVVGRCYHCDTPTETYVNCGNDFCHLHFLVCSECKGEGSAYCTPTCKETCTTS
ncbi:MAG: rhodanese-related sulfurtransferase [Patescibacteria group bacterium]